MPSIPIPADYLARLAVPGRPDLDFDIAGTKLASVVLVDGSLLLLATGGYGYWDDPDDPDGRAFFLFGAPPVERIDISIEFGTANPVVQQAYQIMCGWRDSGEPLRICCAPGLHSVLIDTKSNWLPVPRFWNEAIHPDEG